MLYPVLIALLWPVLVLLRLARGLGMAAVNRIAPARKFFMHEAGGAVGHLPRLLRGEAL